MTQRINISDTFATDIRDASIMAVMEMWHRYREEQNFLTTAIMSLEGKLEHQKRYDLVSKRIPLLEAEFERKIVQIIIKHQPPDFLERVLK